MQKTIIDQFSPFLFIGFMLALVAGAAWYAWSLFTPQPADTAAADPAAIARYKQWIADQDLPFVGSKIKQADLPAVYRKVIDYDVAAGDLKSARGFIALAIQKQLAAAVLAQPGTEAAAALIHQVQHAQRKVEVLKQILGGLPKEPAKLPALADEFCAIPFQAAACPEQAQEIAVLYRTQLQPLKDPDAAVQRVVAEIEKNCLPVEK